MISYFRKEFFLYIPRLIESELGIDENPNSDLKIISALKTKVDEYWKRVESMYIQAIVVQIRSELNIGFISYFYSDLLDKEVDFYYKEKILSSDYDSYVIS